MSDDILPEIPTRAIPKLSDREVLEHTKSIKLMMLGELVDENYVPTDPKEIRAVLAITDSLDSSALGSIRSNQEAATGANAQEAIRLIGEITKNLGNSNPYMADTPVEREVTIEKTLIQTTFVPGETEVGVKDIEYDDFVEVYENKNGV